MTGKRRNSKRGTLLVTANGDVWVLEDTEGSKLHSGSDLVVEGIQTGLDRLKLSGAEALHRSANGLQLIKAPTYSEPSGLNR